MSALSADAKKSFLLIGPWDAKLAEIGAMILPSLAEASSLRDISFDVIGVTTTGLFESKFPTFWEQMREQNPCVHLVASLPEELPPARLLELHHELNLFRVLATTGFAEAEPALYEAMEAAHRWWQDLAVQRLFQEQENRLETLRTELESRVERRTRLLAESRHNAHLRNVRLEGLRKALLTVQQASSLVEMERSLNESLAGTVETSWIRIVSSPRDEEFAQQVAQMDGFTWRIVPLWRDREKIGAAFYMRPKDRPFRREDYDFLDKVSEAVSLTLDRLMKISEAENLKEQWEATFAAIAEPVAMINRAYDVIQSNDPKAIGGKCYERFFARNEPCPGCRRGENYFLEEAGGAFEVQSQLLNIDPHADAFYVNFYTDVKEQRRMERRLVDSAKMAELGTIGSSIAHELNNPLGGVLNFTQLLRMDLPKDHAFSEDLEEIEKGAQRSKEIVENLLGFTRAPRADEMRELDLRDVVKRALQVVQLRTKSAGVAVQFNAPENPFRLHGHLNLLSQGFKNLLERSIDSVLAQRQLRPGHQGHVEITLETTNSADGTLAHVLTLKDDGQYEPGVVGRHGLPLQIASQIFRDQHAALELSSASSPDSWAKISFSRPVLPA